jgi:glycine dehydrogenase subunit 1
LIQSPNFFGAIEDTESFSTLAHKNGSLQIVSVVEPISLGILKSPGELGADIVAGEGQSLGIPMNYGGPSLGLFASLEKYVRNMPGRIVGETVDVKGRRGYVLTLATREQHIRRERATSNICTNQALCALIATVYLAAMGKSGMKEVAEQNIQKAHYAKNALSKIKGLNLKFSGEIFNEFVIETKKPPTEINEQLLKRSIIGGLDLQRHYPELKNCMLFCVTEYNTKEEIDVMLETISKIN